MTAALGLGGSRGGGTKYQFNVLTLGGKKKEDVSKWTNDFEAVKKIYCKNDRG